MLGEYEKKKISLKIVFNFSLSSSINCMFCPLPYGLLDLNVMNEINSSVLQDGAMISFPLFLTYWISVILLGRGVSASALLTLQAG